MNPESSPDTYISDSDLAHEMAFAEQPFREYALMAAHLKDYLVAHREVWTHFDRSEYEAYHRRSAHIDDTQKNASYFAKRAEHASDTVLAAYHGWPVPTVTYASCDARQESNNPKRLKSDRIHRLKLGSIILHHDGATEAVINSSEVTKRYFEELRDEMPATTEEVRAARQAAKEAAIARKLRGHDSINRADNKVLDALFTSEYPRKAEMVASEQIQAFATQALLEPFNLMSGFIRKSDIGPVVYEFITKQAWSQLLDAKDGHLDHQLHMPTKLWKSALISKMAESLVDKFNGRISEVAVMKLPVTDDWKTTFFDQETLDSTYERSIQRLKFIATLKPTGKPETYSTIDTVLYVRHGQDDTNAAMVATTRKADRMNAEALQRSLREESVAVAHIIESSQSREVLSGLPTLGKRN